MLSLYSSPASSGKLLACLLPKAQRDSRLHLLSLRRFTEHTIVDGQALERELEETRKRRVGINRAEHVDGLCGVVVGDTGPAAGPRSGGHPGPAGPHAHRPAAACVPQLQQAAKEIGRIFGVVTDA